MRLDIEFVVQISGSIIHKATENFVSRFPVERCRRQKGCISHAPKARLYGFFPFPSGEARLYSFY